jgi:hypothetical protein
VTNSKKIKEISEGEPLQNNLTARELLSTGHIYVEEEGWRVWAFGPHLE